MTDRLFKPQYPQKAGHLMRWGGLVGTAIPLVLLEAAQSAAHPVVVLTESVSRVQRLQTELTALAGPDNQLPIMTFPDWETLPYDHFSPQQEIVSERLRTLWQLPKLTQGIILLSVPTAMQRVPPRAYIEGHVFQFQVGDTLERDTLRARLAENGYRQVTEVMEPGEYAVRGALYDLFPTGAPHPIRLDLFDNEIETIKSFDVNTQRSLESLNQFELLPAREFPLDEPGIKRFREAWRTHFEGDPTQCSLYEDVSEGAPTAGVEYYLPLFFDHVETLFHYLPANSLLIQEGSLEKTAQSYWQNILNRFDQRAHDRLHPILQAAQLYTRTDELFGLARDFKQCQIVHAAQKAHVDFQSASVPDIASSAHSPEPLRKLKTFLMSVDVRLLFCAETSGRMEALTQLLQEIQLQPKSFSGWQDFWASDAKFGITVLPISETAWLKPQGIIFLSEVSLFDAKVIRERVRKKRTVDPFEAIHHLAELTPGTPVVHQTYGVGEYLGLQKLNLGPVEAEYVTLSYKGGDKIYVPVNALHLISRYTVAEDAPVQLNRLGTDQWSKAKRRAQEKIKDVAAELLDIYARRKAQQGFGYSLSQKDYTQFKLAFGHEETPDQATAIEQVIDDMQAPNPMDRLLCGDVGFGKTEVALRAVFVAANAGKQVAILVPTTLLAQQHYENFRDRFAGWPFSIGLLSRFQSTKEQQTTLEKVEAGQIDILVGTHKLLQPSVKFKDLGLLVIDEEHRFGVKQKDRLKSLRANVDILSMTATPIPRTLNMALSAIRDLSVIATPPARRLPIKTFVQVMDKPSIREAILRELLRGGQTYFLHNEVKTIEQRVAELKEWVPEAKIAFAHGQMPERTLEKIMHDFYHQRFNVLVCSTIIETGIDIPTANTIIIERADKLGLAQLHQLRGRVGRSHHQAYAYCLTPPPKLMTKDAHKRLEALAAHEDLGAGFHIASHDLEIRGAGELLGEEQSGHISLIGYTLYMTLLERAVKALQSGKCADWMAPPEDALEIDCQLPALIPEDYLPDVGARLMLYKRIATAQTQDALDELQVEMIDRFGLLPQQTKNLFALTTLKQLASKLGMTKIEYSAHGGYMEFSDTTKIEPKQIIQLVQIAPKYYKFQGTNRLRLLQQIESGHDRIEALRQLMCALLEKRLPKTIQG